MVKARLLDINILLALAWPSHAHHNQAHEWFQRRKREGFATCPLTQLGFVRLSSNPRFTKEAVPPSAAVSLLARIMELKEHVFWPDILNCKEAFGHTPLIVGHQRFTDFYLAALAQANSGIFATFDRSVPASDFVEVL